MYLGNADIVTQSTKLNAIKTQNGKIKSDVTSQGTKLKEAKVEITKMQKDINSHDARLNTVKVQNDKNTVNLSEYMAKVNDIEHSLEVYGKDIDELKNTPKETNKETENKTEPLYFDFLAKQLNNIKKTEQSHEAYSRRANVIFGGIREQDFENCYHIVDDVCARVLGLPNMHKYVDKCHRVGRKTTSYPRDIIAKFLYHHDADLILSRASMRATSESRYPPTTLRMSNGTAFSCRKCKKWHTRADHGVS